MSTSDVGALDELLRRLDTLQAALPSLLRTFSVPSLEPAERSALFAERSGKLSDALKSLREGTVDHAALLEKCAALVGADASVRQLKESDLLNEQQPDGAMTKDEGDALADLKRVFASSTTVTGTAKSRETGVVTYEPRFPDTTDSDELDKLLADWQTLNKDRITLKLEGMVIRVTVKGLMKAFVALNRAESGPVMAERAACFSLKENRAMYMRSEFALFQKMTDKLMNVIDKSYSRPVRRSNVEHVLAFLTHPPVPF